MKRKKSGVLLKITTVLVVLALLTVIISNRFVAVTDYTVESKKLPPAFDGYKIAVIADLHNTSFGQDNKALLKRLKNSDPDIVLLAGDMVSTSDTDYSVFFSLAEKIAAEYDTYFVVGNHEQALGDNRVSLFCQSVESLGVKVLDNQKVALERGKDSIDLYGMWFNLRYYADRSENASEEEQGYFFNTEAMTEILGSCDNKRYNILLTHNPVYFEAYASWGADLTLSGHIHGGMIRLPFLGGIYSPEKTYFPKYDAGIFNDDGKSMVVSRGLGNGNLGFRLFNCPELVIVTLKSQ